MIIDLHDPKARDPHLSGGKASSLADLMVEDLPVPEGFVVTTRAFEAALAQLELQSSLEGLLEDPELDDMESITAAATPLQERLRNATLPRDLEAALSKALEQQEAKFGTDTLWAVRSSAVAEDLDGASFAGQYDTLLGLRGFSEVRDALLRCWASFLNPHSLHYRRQRGIREVLGAVVVQRLVSADAAGVAFTVDPLTGASDRIVINANFGLGETVVGGQVTPDAFVVKKSSLDILDRRVGSKELATRLVPGGTREEALDAEASIRLCLSDAELTQVGALAKRVEEVRQNPVDLEWAVLNGKAYLLQARAVTASTSMPPPAPERDKPPPGWQPELNTPIDPRYPLYSDGNISEVLPGCTTPLSWSIIGPALEHSFRTPAADLGIIPELPDQFIVLGFFFHRPYLNVSYFVEIAKRMPGLSPATVFEEFVGECDAREENYSAFSARDLLPSNLLRSVGAIRAGLKQGKRLSADIEACRQEYLERTETLGADAYADWDLDQVVAEIDETKEMWHPTVVHIWASQYAVGFFGVLRDLTAKWLGDEGGSLAANLVTGIGSLPSADPAFAIYDLSRLVTSSTELSELFATVSDDQAIIDRLREAASGDCRRFQEELQEFLRKFGHRAVCEAECRNRCWREDPAQVLAHLRNFLGAKVPPPDVVRERQRKASEEAYVAATGKLSSGRRYLFDRVLRESRRRIAEREQMKDLLILYADGGRRLYRRAERLLVERKLLARGDDMYFLVVDEVLALGRGQLAVDEAAQITARRRRDFEWSLAVQVPHLQDGEARLLDPDGQDAAPETGDRLMGIGVSPGKVEGLARVVRDPRENSTLAAGEILVARVTDLGWTPLFLNAAALVVEVGGLLSHGSIVAREYGLPAVVGATGATSRIRTGDRIRVDGNRGEVTILER